jgi:putative membrane protein insertion efficiency factor
MAPAGVTRPLRAGAAWCIRFVVAFYRVTLGPLMGGHCRYDPTCSQYMLDAVAKHGPWRGGWRGLKRIARCHPWGGQGHDPA